MNVKALAAAYQALAAFDVTPRDLHAYAVALEVVQAANEDDEDVADRWSTVRTGMEQDGRDDALDFTATIDTVLTELGAIR